MTAQIDPRETRPAKAEAQALAELQAGLDALQAEQAANLVTLAELRAAISSLTHPRD